MKPVDIIVLTLVAAIGLAICIPLIGSIISGEGFSMDRAKVLSGLVASAISIVGMYVGYKLNDRG